MSEEEVAREVRVAGLSGFVTPTLEAVERRRWHLWIFTAIVMLSLATGMVLLTFEDAPLRQIRLLPLNVIRLLFVGLAALLVLYLVDKELRLRRLTESLIDERVLSAALSNRLKEISVLSEVGKAVNRLLDLNDVLRMILESALDLLGAEEGSIMLLKPDEDRLVVVSAKTGSGDLVEGASVPIGSGIAGWVARTREPLLIAGKVPKDRFVGFDEKDRAPHTAVCVPLESQDELLGVLNVNEYSGAREFTEYELRALQLFAEHAAIAIRNARSFEKERQTVARLEELDRMKTDFIATVSHELRTPLTSIIGAAKTMRRGDGRLTQEHRAEFLSMIERQGARLLGIIEEILSVSRIESGEPRFRREQVDFSETVRQIVADFKTSGAPNPIEVEATEAITGYGDVGLLEQVIVNLVENAIKYSPNSSPVFVRVRAEEGAISMEVADEGKGIPSEELPTIFDRFRQVEESYTRTRGGVGLGLYIVKNLVERSGGTIRVESKLGVGSTFTVTFPVRR